MIGIFGGTFNPIHFGHLRCAVEVREVFGLSEVRLIPSALPPHRQSPSVSALARAEMVELAIEGHVGLVCDRRELARQTPSYMVETLATLREELPDQPLLLFIGIDAFNQLPQWRQWQQLFDYAHLVVMTRPGYQVSLTAAFFQARVLEDPAALRTRLAGGLLFQAVTPLAISATTIRHLVATQQDPSFLLPDVVISYIRQHKLYQAPE